MADTRKLLNYLGRLYPKRLAKLHGDYVGHMAGKLPKEVNKIVLCLDLDKLIIDEILSDKPDLVITHHPLVYGTRYRVFKHDEEKRDFVLYLDEINLPVYSYHTNFDSGTRGMNEALAKRLNLKNIRTLENNIMARGGDLEEPMHIEEFAKFAKEALNVPYGLLINEGKEMISSVAIIGGGGSRSWRDAKEEGYDLYISGDAPHYVRRDVINGKYNYLDLPHEIENIFMDQMEKVLLDFDPTLKIKKITHEIPPRVI